MRTFILVLFSLVLWLFTPAHAQTISDCGSITPGTNGDHAPGFYDDEACSALCTYSATVLTCDPVNAPSQGMQVFAVEDYAQNGDGTYSVWGEDETGTDFCCFIDDDSTHNISTLVIVGTDYADQVVLTYSNRNIEHIDTNVFANDGADNLVGSDDAGSMDSLFGMDGANTIVGNDGDDTLTGYGHMDDIEGNDGDDYIGGGDGDDTLDGGDGADIIYGGYDDDTIDGGAGADTIYGESGLDSIIGGSQGDTLDGGYNDDVINGGDGNDTLIGGLGADILCGGASSGSGSDTFYAAGVAFGEVPNDFDKLWSPASANTPTGTMQNGDGCGDSSHGAFAGYLCLMSKPAECPI